MKKLGEGKKDRRIWTGAVRMGKDRKGRTPPDVLKRRMKERKERDIQDRKDEDACRKKEMSGDDDIFLSDDEKVQDALKQLERLAEEDMNTTAADYADEDEDIHGAGFPHDSMDYEEFPPALLCACYQCCRESVMAASEDVIDESRRARQDHEENEGS